MAEPIQQSEVLGEPGTGYEDPNGKGPFECANCHHFSKGHCDQPTMMARSKRPKDAEGYVKVDPHGCCEYVERIGNKASARKHWLSKRKDTR
jgi:hypothetical protein